MNFNLSRRHAARLVAGTLAAATVAIPTYAHEDDDGYRSGKIFISTNSPAGNAVLVYARRVAGPAVLLGSVPTGGQGTGGGLGSQGAVTLSRNGRWLFVVNAASNTVSTFEIRGTGLELRSVVDSGGLMPTSVTEHDGRVYVLNAAGSGNVAGFRNDRGTLRPLAGAVGALSANTGTAPGQVGLSDDGDVLVVTERATGRLTTFSVAEDGALEHRTVSSSSGAVPFGFAFTKRDVLIVSEAAASTVSSYRFDRDSVVPQLLTASLATTQGAACWIAVTPNGRFAFSANAATSSVSSFAVAADGRLSLVAAQAALTGANAGALDMAVSRGGRQLHVFASRGLQIVSYTIRSDGELVALGSAGGMPAGSAGLAAN